MKYEAHTNSISHIRTDPEVIFKISRDGHGSNVLQACPRLSIECSLGGPGHEEVFVTSGKITGRPMGRGMAVNQLQCSY